MELLMKKAYYRLAHAYHLPEDVDARRGDDNLNVNNSVLKPLPYLLLPE